MSGELGDATESSAASFSREPSLDPGVSSWGDCSHCGSDAYPRVLHVDTGHTWPEHRQTEVWERSIDYGALERVPRWWRAIEVRLGIDWALALQAARIAESYDVILAGSERVGIPLALMGVRTPLVTLVYNVASRRKRLVLKRLRIPRRWMRVGYLTPADRDFMISYYDYPPDRLFQYVAAPLDWVTDSESHTTGPMVSVGASKRDYSTLVDALRELPGHRCDVYATSRYPDEYRGRLDTALPDWIQFRDFITPDNLAQVYQAARFVVIPLVETTQFSAGFTTALEAHAAGRAVIATATPGMAQYIQPGVTGLLVPPRDPIALRAAIRRLWECPDEAAAMGRAGRRYAEQEFDPTEAAHRAMRVMAELHAERRGRS